MTRVLVVEDEFTLLLLAEMTLEEHGYEIVTATNGKRGLAAVAEHGPDVIVTDFMMPVMDGMEMIEALRKDGVATPVLVTSAVPENRLPVTEGVTYQAYLQKPYREERLVALVEAQVQTSTAGE